MRLTRNRMLSAALAGAGFVVFGLAPLPAMAEGSMVVRNFVLSHGVHDREPVGNTDSFRVEDGNAFAFARIQNTGAPTTVNFVWYHGGATHASIPVKIGASPGWRTWSTAKLRPGNWRVELVDAQGEVMLEKAFTVEPASIRSADMPENGPENGMQGNGRVMGGPDDNAGSGDIPASVTFPMR